MDYLLKSSAVLLLMYIGYALFLKKETFFNHNRWFLLAGIATAALLPLIEIPVYITIESTVSEIPFQFQYVPTELIVKEEPFDWLQLATYIYLAGVIIFFIQFLFQFGSLAILLLKNSKNKEGIYTYVIVKNRISPFSFFKWIVYNPNLFSEEELQLILNHEKVHVRQWHSIDIILSRLACVVFWFNPICWLYHKSIQQNLEYIADNETQNVSASQKDYQQLLLKTSIGQNNINLTSNFYNSLIKKRIVMLQKNRSKSINRWKSAFVIPFFALFLMSFNTKKIFVEVPTIEQNLALNNATKSIEVYFSKETTDKTLKDIKKKLKAEGVAMTIKEKTRNAEGLLTSLSLMFESDGNTANYRANDKTGIKSFYFKKGNNGSMAVGPTEIIEVIEEQEVIEITEDEPIIEIIEEEENEENPQASKTIIKLNNIDEEKNTFKIKGDSIYIVETSPTVKGRYSFYSRDTVVIGKPINASKIKANGNVKIRSNSFTIKTDSVNYKNVIKVRNTKGTNPVYILNGKRISKKEFKKINGNKIKSLDVVKGKSAIKTYGKSAKNGVIIIKTKEKGPWKINTKIDSVKFYKESSEDDIQKYISSGKRPVIIIDNKIAGNMKIKDIDYDVTKSISILKGEGAINLYGEKAKDGAIVIFTEDYKTDTNPKYKVRVGSLQYIDDENKSNNSTLYYINDETTDEILKLYKTKLSALGITAKFNRVKRNRNGKITSIKVSLSDKSGDKSSASFKDNEGIPQIAVGKKGNSLIASSNL